MGNKYYRTYVTGEGDKKCMNVCFDSLHAVLDFINESERTEGYKYYHVSDEVSSSRDSFTKTHTFDEAGVLLTQGWEYMAHKLNDELKGLQSVKKAYTKNVYSPVGYQACVPRYLQGLPDSMIYKKQIPRKQPVLDVVKDIGYAGIISQETIIKESAKVLDLINTIEQKGTKTNLYISFVSWSGYKDCKYVNIQVKVKQSTQRMNIKQLAFPLVHPSMFRRIIFAVIERAEECKNFGIGYGHCTDYVKTKEFFKGKIYIPRILENEERITDINKYRVD